MESYSLFQLNEYIRRVVALNFREPLWIEAEISQIRESRGNYYIELVEKEQDDDNIIAQTSAVIWYRNFKFIEKKIGDIVHDLLEDGTLVRIKCKVDFHERYGLKLIIEDLDPNYTYGKLELRRQEIINKIEEEGLMDLNKGLLVPTVVQRIAVISSSNAAGYQDFKKQIVENSYDYTFKMDLYDCAVQGAKVSQDTVSAISKINSSKKDYHLAIIIRGGGSKLDLSGYDDYDIAKAIALSEVPFVIGIGHEIDSTVADMVACISLKTPTAVADFIIEHNMQYEGRLEQLVGNISRMSTSQIAIEQQSLISMKDRLMSLSTLRIQEELSRLDFIHHRLFTEVSNMLNKEAYQLSNAILQLDAVDPVKILSQGYSILKKEGIIVRSTSEVHVDDKISITLQDGDVSGIITK